MDRNTLINFYMENAGWSRERAEAAADDSLEMSDRFLPQLNKVCTPKQLREFNDAAVERDYNRAVTDEFFASLDPDGTELCTMALYHNHKHMELCEPHIRTQWMCKIAGQEEPKSVFIDMPPEMYMDLDEWDPDEKQVKPAGWRAGEPRDLPPLSA